MIRKYEIDESKLVCRSNGTIDWRGSFPQLVSETSSEWARRRHDLASHLAYVRRSPERVKAATKNADDWKKRNADKHQAWTDRYVIENRGQVLFNAARLRALKKNLDLDITREWVQQRIDTGVCEVTNLPFLIQKGRTPFAPSIDRTDPQKGYTRDNCKVVIWGYNTAKNQFTDADLLIISEAIVKALKKDNFEEL